MSNRKLLEVFYEKLINFSGWSDSFEEKIALAKEIDKEKEINKEDKIFEISEDETKVLGIIKDFFNSKFEEEDFFKKIIRMESNINFGIDGKWGLGKTHFFLHKILNPHLFSYYKVYYFQPFFIRKISREIFSFLLESKNLRNNKKFNDWFEFDNWFKDLKKFISQYENEINNKCESYHNGGNEWEGDLDNKEQKTRGGISEKIDSIFAKSENLTTDFKQFLSSEEFSIVIMSIILAYFYYSIWILDGLKLEKCVPNFVKTITSSIDFDKEKFLKQYEDFFENFFLKSDFFGGDIIYIDTEIYNSDQGIYSIFLNIFKEKFLPVLNRFSIYFSNYLEINKLTPDKNNYVLRKNVLSQMNDLEHFRYVNGKFLNFISPIAINTFYFFKKLGRKTFGEKWFLSNETSNIFNFFYNSKKFIRLKQSIFLSIVKDRIDSFLQNVSVQNQTGYNIGLSKILNVSLNRNNSETKIRRYDDPIYDLWEIMNSYFLSFRNYFGIDRKIVIVIDNLDRCNKDFVFKFVSIFGKIFNYPTNFLIVFLADFQKIHSVYKNEFSYSNADEFEYRNYIKKYISFIYEYDEWKTTFNVLENFLSERLNLKTTKVSPFHFFISKWKNEDIFFLKKTYFKEEVLNALHEITPRQYKSYLGKIKSDIDSDRTSFFSELSNYLQELFEDWKKNVGNNKNFFYIEYIFVIWQNIFKFKLLFNLSLSLDLPNKDKEMLKVELLSLSKREFLIEDLNNFFISKKYNAISEKYISDNDSIYKIFFENFDHLFFLTSKNWKYFPRSAVEFLDFIKNANFRNIGIVKELLNFLMGGKVNSKIDFETIKISFLSLLSDGLSNGFQGYHVLFFLSVSVSLFYFFDEIEASSSKNSEEFARFFLQFFLKNMIFDIFNVFKQNIKKIKSVLDENGEQFFSNKLFDIHEKICVFYIKNGIPEKNNFETKDFEMKELNLEGILNLEYKFNLYQNFKSFFEDIFPRCKKNSDDKISNEEILNFLEQIWKKWNDGVDNLFKELSKIFSTIMNFFEGTFGIIFFDEISDYEFSKFKFCIEI